MSTLILQDSSTPLPHQGAPAALVTGATRGIGREIARALSRRGYEVIICGRDRRGLDSLAEECGGRERVRVVVADLVEKDGVREILAEVERSGGRVDVLVNNAGLGAVGSFAESDLSTQIEMIQVNVVALVSLTHGMLPSLRAAPQGRILNVASTAAFASGPFMAVYYATKAFVLAFSEAIRAELQGSGVRVSTLCPGPTATNFDRTAGMAAPRTEGPGVMSARRVAEIGIRGMLRGRRLIVPGPANKAMLIGARLLPRNALAALTGRLNRSKLNSRLK